MTGSKWKQKKYISHSGYPGGQKIISVENQFHKNPNKVIEKAVKGMLPKNKLGNLIFKNLKVFLVMIIVTMGKNLFQLI